QISLIGHININFWTTGLAAVKLLKLGNVNHAQVCSVLTYDDCFADYSLYRTPIELILVSLETRLKELQFDYSYAYFGLREGV
ncbi:hypothetical protein VIGAN_09118300, partial [Vigna angularis var. angularis]